MALTYERVEWMDAPDLSTPLSAENLNRMDIAIAKIIAYLNDPDSGGEKIHSHVGMIVQSTTLDTAAKVIAEYGGTEWQQITGRFLIAADGANYPVNSVGGSADAVVPSHTHIIGNPTSTSTKKHSHKLRSSAETNINVVTGLSSADVSGPQSGVAPMSVLVGANTTPLATLVSDTEGIDLPVRHSHSCGTAGVDGEGKNIPPYLAVYTWLRTA